MPANFLNPARAKVSTAFTLVELLVSMAVLVLLIGMVMQLMNNATKATAASDRRLDADSQARTVFSRMAEDFNCMLLRKDADCFFVKNTGNDAFYFFSETPNYTPGGTSGTLSAAAFVGYRIANRSTAVPVFPNGVIERVGFALYYNVPDNSTLNMVFLTRPAPTMTAPSPTPFTKTTMSYESANIGSSPSWDNGPTLSGSATGGTGYSQLSPDVFRMEFCFLMKDGTYYVPKAAGSNPWADTSSPTFLDQMLKIRTDAAAIIVTIAILDSKSRVIVSDMTKVRDALTDVGATDNTPAIAKTWNDTINSRSFAQTANIPLAAASQVRVYQRCFYFKRN